MKKETEIDHADLVLITMLFCEKFPEHNMSASDIDKIIEAASIFYTNHVNTNWEEREENWIDTANSFVDKIFLKNQIKLYIYIFLI